MKKQVIHVLAFILGTGALVVGIGAGSWTSRGPSLDVRSAAAQVPDEEEPYCEDYGFQEEGCAVSGRNCDDGHGSYHRDCPGWTESIYW